MRLQKFLAECGVASRRASEQLIAEGRVTVNGAVAALGATIDPDADAVALDGAPVTPSEKVYLLLHKPAGVITTAKDTHGRKTVCYLVREAGARVVPVGRLDQDVEGILLLTNDGELAHRLTHPSYQIDKVYAAEVYGIMPVQTAQKLKKGVMLEDGLANAADVRSIATTEKTTRILMVLREGRNREVKRLCKAVRHPVKTLKRTAFAGLEAGDLKPGEWRFLTNEEVAQLKRMTRHPAG